MAGMDTRAIEGEIDRFRSLGLEELRREWRRLYHAEPPRISRDLLVLATRLQTSGNRAWRARQGDPAQAANDGEGLADNGPRWSDAEPQPEARRASCSGMARPYAHRHGHGRWVRVCRDALSVADQDRQNNHRSALVGSALLWAAHVKCAAPEPWGARWLNRTRRHDASPKRHAVRFTPENRRRKGWSRPSTRSTPSGKPAPPSFSRKSTKAGRCCRRSMMMAGFPAARWAADREQAKILHRYILGILRPPLLWSMVQNYTAGAECPSHGGRDG